MLRRGEDRGRSRGSLALLPSPLLGPAVWGPVAELLRQRGWATTAAAIPAGLRTPDEVLTAFASTVSALDSPVLVAHSNAGLFVPGLADRQDVPAAVFVDAGLAGDVEQVPLAPPDFLTFLAGLADASGTLPPWPTWWGSSSFESLVPDLSLRAAVAREARSLPLSYFQACLPIPSGWERMPCAYLAFGDTYAAEREEAVRRGWPVRTLDGRHLHMLVDPEAVADAIEDLVQQLTS